MALEDEVWREVHEIFDADLDVADGRTIPDLADIPFGNRGKQIRLTALFVDIRKSTELVDTLGVLRAAKIYKAYLRGVSKIVRDRGGELLSFNGDGMVAGFVGENAANTAVLTGFNLNWLCNRVLKPRIDETLGHLNSPMRFNWGVGIDDGKVVVIKGGMRGDANSDLVWAGTPVNHAVKICAQASYPYTMYIAGEVYQQLAQQLRTDTTQHYWERWYWQQKNRYLYRTAWNFGTGYIASVPTPLNGLLTAYLAVIRPAGTMADLARPVAPQGPAFRGLLDAYRRTEPGR